MSESKTDYYLDIIRTGYRRNASAMLGSFVLIMAMVTSLFILTFSYTDTEWKSTPFILSDVRYFESSSKGRRALSLYSTNDVEYVIQSNYRAEYSHRRIYDRLKEDNALQEGQQYYVVYAETDNAFRRHVKGLSTGGKEYLSADAMLLAYNTEKYWVSVAFKVSVWLFLVYNVSCSLSFVRAEKKRQKAAANRQTQ